MPVSSGTGNAVLNRWYYNAQSQVCVSFVYSGQGGNSNNFQTHEDCAEACPEFRFVPGASDLSPKLFRIVFELNRKLISSKLESNSAEFFRVFDFFLPYSKI